MKAIHIFLILLSLFSCRAKKTVLSGKDGEFTVTYSVIRKIELIGDTTLTLEQKQVTDGIYAYKDNKFYMNNPRCEATFSNNIIYWRVKEPFEAIYTGNYFDINSLATLYDPIFNFKPALDKVEQHKDKISEGIEAIITIQTAMIEKSSISSFYFKKKRLQSYVIKKMQPESALSNLAYIQDSVIIHKWEPSCQLPDSLFTHDRFYKDSVLFFNNRKN